MSSPRFSVITPVYNREQVISQVIDSVLAQTSSDWEMILVDDGSTDNTAAVRKQYAARDSRIHYIHQPNHGVSSARNTGIRNACGEYIVFLDSDNFLKENMISVLSFRADAYPDADMICFGYDTVINVTPPPREFSPCN